MQQNKQQAENRLVTAMQQKGATERTAMQEKGAGERASLQAATQREGMAAQSAWDDKRAAETEKARREDRKFSQAMQETNQEFQAKQSELDREQQKAIISGDRKYKDEIAKRREALRRFNIELNMDAQERNTNAMLSIIKGSLKRESSMEKAKTMLYEEAEKFDKDKDIYTKTVEKVTEAVDFDKRMDLPIVGEPTMKTIPAGSSMGFSAGFTRVRTGDVKPGTQADPIAVLQDQINKYGGNISVEEMAPVNIYKIETQIQEGKIKTEDINKTFGAIEGMLSAVSKRRVSATKGTDESDFWQDTHMKIVQMRDGLEGLANSKKKITDSETETVGARVQYALGSINNSSLGGRAARMRDLMGGEFQNVFEEMTKSVQVPKLYDISEGMNEYDVEYRTWFNNYLSSRYPELQGVE
ncbi:hypothetical protein KAR91_14535 [Candidatus Pacearchaeota archaeon]|nr:hypothetical protein [Candidatus Pacearchaeota archaeon]